MTSLSAKTIDLPNYGPIEHIGKDADDYLNRTTVLYGASGTGKTTILKWILKIIKPHIPTVVVVAPTNSANGVYTGCVPKRCVYTELTIDILREVLDRQKNAKKIYNRANKLKTLKSLFTKCSDRSIDRLLKQAMALYKSSINGIRQSKKHDYAQKKQQKKEIKEKHTRNIIALYKTTIKKYESDLANMDLTNDEKYALKYLRFNPNILLILDDCASSIQAVGKDKAIKELFYEGRHYCITSIYTMQDDKKLLPGVRINTFRNFFTDSNCAINFFSAKANGFTSKDKKNANKIAETLLAESKVKKRRNYKTMVFSRLDAPRFKYILADELRPFKIGSPYLWELCGQLPESQCDTHIEETNKYFDVFSV